VECGLQSLYQGEEQRERIRYLRERRSSNALLEQFRLTLPARCSRARPAV